jgi:hypothetical protein
MDVLALEFSDILEIEPRTPMLDPAASTQVGRQRLCRFAQSGCKTDRTQIPYFGVKVTAQRLPTLNTSPELLFSGEQQVLVQWVGRDGDPDPSQNPRKRP